METQSLLAAFDRAETKPEQRGILMKLHAKVDTMTQEEFDVYQELYTRFREQYRSILPIVLPTNCGGIESGNAQGPVVDQ